MAMLVSCPSRYELDQRLRLIGKAVRRDLDGAQQVITLEHGTVVIAYVEPKRPIEQRGESFGGKCTQPAASTGIGHDRNDDVGFAGMGDDLCDALRGKAVVTRKDHVISDSVSACAALVGAAEPEFGRVVEYSDAGIDGRQCLHPLQGTIGASVIDQNDLEVASRVHRFAHRPDSCSDVVLLI